MHCKVSPAWRRFTCTTPTSELWSPLRELLKKDLVRTSPCLLRWLSD